MADQFPAPTKMVLSPAAQAVLDAAGASEPGIYATIAAALRAAADQVVPVEVSLRRGMRPGGTGSITSDEFKQDQRADTRRKILAIAAELEANR